MKTNTGILERINEVQRYFCEEQSYGVFFKIKNSPITLEVDVFADGEFELTEKEVVERGLNVLLGSQSHLTSDKLEFLNADLYGKKYAPIEPTFQKQSFFVKFSTRGDVMLKVGVAFYNQPAVTDDEIYNAANELLEKSIEIEGEFFREDISEDEIIESPAPTHPYLHVIRPDEHREEWSDEEMAVHLKAMGYSLTNSEDEGEFSTAILADVAANSEKFKWDDVKEVWYQ